MKVETRLIPTIEIWPNNGQISGLPKNPRFIRDERYEKLVKSIKDDPEMLDLRECIVFPYAAAYVAIAGNMRLRATIEVANMDEVEYSELIKEKKVDKEFDFKSWLASINVLRKSKSIPCKILPENTSAAKLRAIAIKDNVVFGQDSFDMLKEDWDQIELEDFGMISIDFGTAIDDEQEDFEKESTPSEPIDLSGIVPVPELKIEFDDLQMYDSVKLEVEELLKSYPGARIKA
ncbi:hypothetical protein [Pedobacter gandavensis]|uniref:ParB/Sulfiredoxin domain-containing protein n=1 Tax=Pedobacter gandavensis TaxID=2679963 RepID=A0ABR6EU79_9SPHI|nr:hypothetical protein [Pedobacter gandavensis]MBB2148821.1 hypothetical protein [Pedobacter gandavensis]